MGSINENNGHLLVRMEAPGFDVSVINVCGQIHVYFRGRITSGVPRGSIDDLISYLATLNCGGIELHVLPSSPRALSSD